MWTALELQENAQCSRKELHDDLIPQRMAVEEHRGWRIRPLCGVSPAGLDKPQCQAWADSVKGYRIPLGKVRASSRSRGQDEK